MDLSRLYPEKENDWLRSKQYLIKVFDAITRYDSALICCQELLLVYEERVDNAQIFRLQNNIGYYRTLLGDYELKLQIYKSAQYNAIYDYMVRLYIC